MRKTGLIAAILIVLLAAGCEGFQQPVNGGNKPLPTASPTLTPSPALTESSPSPAPTPTPVPVKAAPYIFPLKADGLCGKASLPEGFSKPLYVAADGTMFLYLTTDSRIVKASWDGAAYAPVPVVEGVEAGSASAVYMDTANNRLCCTGSKLFSNDRRGSAAVIVDMRTGARCNADDLTGWKQENRALSGSFQYCGGLILAQVMEYADEVYAPIDRWVVVDIADKSDSALNMESILKKNLPDKQTLVSYRLALTGPERLLAACLTRGKNEQTGAEEYACVALELDLKGRVQGSKAISFAGKKPEECILPNASLFDASPDGKYLLYSDTQGVGIYLYDAATGIEYTVLDGGSGTRVFTQWGADGIFYYGAAGKTSSKDITIFKTSVSDIKK